jgi:hypothetical protein
MFKINDKVIMIQSDSWVEKGLTGRVDSQNLPPYFSSIKILWDNGEVIRVMKDYLRIINESNDPNMAFCLAKLNRQKRR